MRVCVDITLRALGTVRLDAARLPVFPRAPSTGGVYRFRLLRPGWRGAYIGEADQLARRFQHYRTPGPRQQTNIRVATLITNVLGVGGSVGVDIAAEGSLVIDGTERRLDMTSKAGRVLAESALLADEIARGDAEILNL